jgi:Tfp pilus assembly protein PilF
MNLSKLTLVAGLLAAVFISGCVVDRSAEGINEQEVKFVPTEVRKTELQTRIDQKFSDADAHFELAQLHRADGMWKKANSEYNLALQLKPGHKAAQAALVKMNIEKSDDVKSKLLADIYMNQAKGSAGASLLLGKAFQKEMLDDYAFTCFETALMLAPNSAALHRQMGYYYKRKGDTIRAQEAFKRSFQLDPYNADVAGQLGKMGIAVVIPRKQDNQGEKYDKMLEEQSPK